VCRPCYSASVELERWTEPQRIVGPKWLVAVEVLLVSTSVLTAPDVGASVLVGALLVVPLLFAALFLRGESDRASGLESILRRLEERFVETWFTREPRTCAPNTLANFFPAVLAGEAWTPSPRRPKEPDESSARPGGRNGRLISE
jgi:hypothetical protein